MSVSISTRSFVFSIHSFDLVKINIVFLKQFYTQGLDISLRDIYDKGNNVLAEFLYRDRDLAEEFLNRHISGQIYTR
jgi:hypothetical protein